MAANRVDCLVIGSGVVGLAVARALALRGREVLVLDKASTVGAETSSRNSQVIHSGIYYPQQSWKARLCVKGKNMLYDFCERRAVPVNRCGKLIVATSEEQFHSTLRRLHEQALRNGVNDVQLMEKDQVLQIEPLVESYGALYSPSTGVLDAHALMTSLLVDAESNGATLALNATVDDARIERNSDISIHAAGTWITANHVVNAAGLWSDRIARLIHNNPSAKLDRKSNWLPPRQYYCKGTYFQLQGFKSPPFQRLIYPIPDQRGGLGIHATIDMAGRVRFGPDVEWLNVEAEPDHMDYAVDSRRVDAFYASIRAYFPSLPDESLSADYTGVRPKLTHPSFQDPDTYTPIFQDFQIVTSKEHGVPRLVHLFGIESPGLTSSMAMAEHVCETVVKATV